MKTSIKQIFIFSFLATLLFACKKDENKIYIESSTAPVLKASSTTPMVLLKDNEANNAITFSWTNPSYSFTTGISSQNVTYTIQIDKESKNFTGSFQEISIVNDLASTLTIKQLNAALLALELPHLVAAPVVIRLKASLAGGAAPLYSNVIKTTITPYLDVKYPVPANLYIIGDATPDGWGNPVTANQKLTQTNAYTFEITLTLNAGKSYLFLPVNGSWNAKYGGMGANNANDPNGDEFKPEGGDIKAPDAGKYKITVNFKNGRFSLTKV